MTTNPPGAIEAPLPRLWATTAILALIGAGAVLVPSLLWPLVYSRDDGFVQMLQFMWLNSTETAALFLGLTSALLIQQRVTSSVRWLMLSAAFALILIDPILAVLFDMIGSSATVIDYIWWPWEITRVSEVYSYSADLDGSLIASLASIRYLLSVSAGYVFVAGSITAFIAHHRYSSPRSLSSSSAVANPLWRSAGILSVIGAGLILLSPILGFIFRRLSDPSFDGWLIYSTVAVLAALAASLGAVFILSGRLTWALPAIGTSVVLALLVQPLTDTWSPSTAYTQFGFPWPWRLLDFPSVFDFTSKGSDAIIGYLGSASWAIELLAGWVLLAGFLMSIIAAMRSGQTRTASIPGIA